MHRCFYILCLLIGLMSCEKDIQVRCHQFGPSYKVCHTNIYANGSFQGEKLYLYDEDERLKSIEYLDQKSDLKAVERFYYTGNRLLKSEKRRPDSTLIAAVYNEFYDGQLTKRLILKNGNYESHSYQYNENGLLERELISGDVIAPLFKRFDYNDNADLIREWRFNPDSSLIEMDLIETVTPTMKRVLTYDDLGSLISWKTQSFEDGVMTSEVIYNEEGEVASNTEYSFSQGKLSTLITTTHTGQETEKLDFFYFPEQE